MTHPDRNTPTIPTVPRAAWLALLLIWLLSLIPKLLGAHNMVWEIEQGRSRQPRPQAKKVGPQAENS